MLSRTPEEALRKWINELSAPYATASQTSFVWDGARQLLTKYDAQSTELEALRTKSQAQASMLEASAQREAALQCALSQAEGELLHANLECLLRPAPPPDQALSTRVRRLEDQAALEVEAIDLIDDIVIRVDSLDSRVKALEARPSTVPTVQATQVASPRWKPPYDLGFWSLDANGVPQLRTWRGDRHDEPMFTRGNVFRTKSEAEASERKRLVLQKLQDLADASGPVLSTWYEVMHDEFGWGVFDVRKSTPGAIRFKTCKSADHALQVLGPELEVLRP